MYSNSVVNNILVWFIYAYILNNILNTYSIVEVKIEKYVRTGIELMSLDKTYMYNTL